MAQAFAPDDAYQFDWSIETVCLAGQTLKVNIAHFRLCHSRAFFVCAYPNQKADMLMDAHNRAFAFFGGIPARGIYDNMKTAVTRIGKGKEREFNAQFLQMMTRFFIEPVACTPASGWEKGQVERQIRHLRERLFKPTLAFDSFTSLNDYLQQQCQRLMQQHKHPKYRQPINDIWEREKQLDGGMPAPEAVLNIINRLKEPPPPRFHIRNIPLTVPPSVDCSRYDRLLTLSGKQTDTMKEKHHAA